MGADRLDDEKTVRARLADSATGCRVEMIPGGPALVRGASSIEDAGGQSHRIDRPVVAVCTCGLTQRAPWCDATHKFVVTAT
jgi:hypothetical protein